MKAILCNLLMLLLWSTVGLAAPYQNPAAPVEDRVQDLLARMTMDEKIGQMIQPERASVSSSEVQSYLLGSLLNTNPNPNTPAAWADMIDSHQAYALATRLQIPILYASDGVHGHNNAYGATIFPHNIGLGATRNAGLVREVARISAKEMSATGVHWTFAPVVAVARDERWGRTYESLGEDPGLQQLLAPSAVQGFQGATMGGEGVVATAKHYVGDGGTTGGQDQGNTVLDEATLRAIHLPGYLRALDARVGTIMASFSSWNGLKIHEHQYLLTTVLKGELGFDGFVVSDYNGMYQVSGATNYEKMIKCVNAGIDMFMLDGTWRDRLNDLKTAVANGRVSVARINDAVSRILRIKFRSGLFEYPYTDRTLLNDGSFGSQAHRNVARQAVRESLVLLKNSNNILPLSKTADVFVCGKSANDIGLQSGGWTITWQGASGNTTPGTTILQGMRLRSGSSLAYSANCAGAGGHDVAVVVIGEMPYAEFLGDNGTLALDQTDLTALNNAYAAGVPVVAVLVTGRPLMIESHLARWTAVVAAWLPGTEGAGVADVLYGEYDFSGKLPCSWPRTISQVPINVGDGKDPLFAYGFGLTYQGSGTEQSPYGGTPRSVPGVIEAEDYDVGGEGVAFHDSTSGNNGGLYRSDAVDIEATTDAGGGHNVGWIESGEWLEYTINVAEAGTYRVNARVGSLSAGGTLHLEFDGLDQTGPMSFVATGGWQNWMTTSSKLFALEAGVQVLRLVTDTSLFNVNRLEIVRDETAPPPDPAEPNLALGKVAVASSTQSTAYAAGHAVDGNLSTYWSSASVSAAWIYVDLGATCDIERIKLDWGSAYAKGYAVAVSTDLTNWNTLWWTNEGQGATLDLIGLAGSGRYVRVNSWAPATTGGIALAEIGVYSDLGSGGSVVTVTKPADQSGTVGVPSSLQVAATDSANGTLAYSATGLPTGLGISSTTGLISGTPTTTGTFTPTIRVASNAGGNAQTTFNWIITAGGSPSANLALNKAAVASSTLGAEYAVSRAVDGSTATRWTSAAVSSAWMYVDLGASYRVDRVKLVWGSDYSTGYSVGVSADGTNWTTAWFTTTGTGGTVDMTGLAAEGRYLRVNSWARATASGISLSEVEVYGQGGGDPGSVNLALSKTALASSLEGAPYAAAKAFDGNMTSRWSSQFADPQWLQVDLGARYNVSRVKLIWEAAYGASYRIQLSNDAVAWTDIYSTTAGKGGTVDLTSVTGVGRYVRMYGESRGTSWGYSLWEMEVYGTLWQ